MNVDYHKFPIRNVLALIQHYDPNKYWKRCDYVIQKKVGVVRKIFCLLYVKRCDAFNNSSMGTDWGRGAVFDTPPKLPHGLKGIIVSPDAHIGKNCTIFHHVTIGNDYRNVKNAPIIGDNVTIYPGAKILGKVKVGDNVEIGANSVVTSDIPSNTLVVAGHVRLIDRKAQENGN